MNIFNQYKSMIWYGVIFVGLFIVIIIEAQFFISKANALSSNESELKSRIELLQTRNNTLTSLSPEVIAASKQISTVLPAENSVLLVVSQVRNAAASSNINIKSLTTGSVSDTSDPKAGSTQVGIIVDGESSAVLNFLTNLTTMAPLIQINTVNFVTNPTSTVAQVSLNSYWSPFPTQLPAITEPVTALTPEETKLLTELSAYSAPIVANDQTESTSSAIVVNTAPFAPIR